MYYIAPETIIAAFNAIKDNVKNPFFGILGLLRQSEDSVLKPNTTIQISCKELSQWLDYEFYLSEQSATISEAFKYARFSTVWESEVSTSFIKKSVDILAIIAFIYKYESFDEVPTNSYLVAKFCKEFKISEKILNQWFRSHSFKIEFDNRQIRPEELRIKLGIKDKTLSFNKPYSVDARAGELTRGPFIQPLYASVDTVKSVLISNVDTSTFYPTSVEKPEQVFKPNEEYSKLLFNKRNLILTGAPGTGKTFIAKSVAADIVSNGMKDWDTLIKEGCQQITFVQFHPSYDYTDFVEGLRPAENGEFRRQDGIFKEFCKRALGEEDVVLNNSDNLFNKVYSELIDDIRSGNITTYERISAEDKKVGVNYKGRIVYKPEGPHPKTESIRNMRLLFDYYVSQQHFKIEKTERKEMYGIISNLTEGKTKGLDFTEYMWTLNQLLSRVKPEDIKSFSQNFDQGEEKQFTKPYIFIVDEINRGELSKIFGELFYSIEPDYRGPKGTVQTQYNNMVDEDDVFKSGFYIPENVYIIGTMNDVDRGVEAMDFAIRRRFAWKEVTAEESATNMGINRLAEAKMKALNNALIENGLTKAYCIGGAYFRKLEGDNFKELWDFHLEGIIFEYFRGEPDAQTKLEAIKKAYEEAKLSGEAPSPKTTVSTETIEK